MTEGDGLQADGLQTDVAHSAHIWNYRLGGKDNYAADRAGTFVCAGLAQVVSAAAGMDLPRGRAHANTRSPRMYRRTSSNPDDLALYRDPTPRSSTSASTTAPVR